MDNSNLLRTSTIGVVVLIVSLLASCADAPPAESIYVETHVAYIEDLPEPAQKAFENALNGSSAETSDDVESTVTETAEPELFVPEEYYEIIDTIVYYDEIYDTDYDNLDIDFENYAGVWEVLYEENSKDIIGFAFLDIDGDNVAELAILDCSDYYYGFRIIDMYTYCDNEVKHLLSGWYRCRFYLTNDYDVICEGSSGAMYSSVDYLKYDKESHEYIFVESYFTYPLSDDWEDGIGVYHTSEKNYFNESGLDYSKVDELEAYTESFDIYATYGIQQFDAYDFENVTTITDYCESKEG